MADVKFSELSAATSAGGTDIMAIAQGGVSKKLTLLLLQAFVLGTNYAAFQGPSVARTYTLPDANATLAILGANLFTGDQNLQDNSLIRAILKDCAGAFYDAGNVTSLDYVNGSSQRWAPTGTKTLTISNWPASGSEGYLFIEGVNLAAATLTWPTINWVKKDGTFTTSISTYLTDISATLQSSGTDYVLLWTRDGGTTIRGKLVR